MSKAPLYSGDEKERAHAIAMLTHVLGEILKLLHPFIPFVTEEIYSKFAPKGEILMMQQWPAYNKHRVYRRDEANFEGLRDVIGAIRNIRNEMNVPPSKKINAFIIAVDEKFYAQAKAYIQKLAGVNEISFVKDKSEVEGRVSVAVARDAEVLIPLGDLVDSEKEKERIMSDIKQTQAIIDKTNALLANEAFVSRAPQKLVDGEREKLKNAIDKLGKLKDKYLMFE